MAGKRVEAFRYEGVMRSMGEKPLVITDMELEEPLDSSLASLSCIICLRMKALLIYYLLPLFSFLFTLRRSCQTLADRNKISAGELGASVCCFSLTVTTVVFFFWKALESTLN